MVAREGDNLALLKSPLFLIKSVKNVITLM